MKKLELYGASVLDPGDFFSYGLFFFYASTETMIHHFNHSLAKTSKPLIPCPSIFVLKIPVLGQSNQLFASTYELLQAVGKTQSH